MGSLLVLYYQRNIANQVKKTKNYSPTVWSGELTDEWFMVYEWLSVNKLVPMHMNAAMDE